MTNQVTSAGLLLKQANQLKRVGKLDEAIALYHQVIDINPHFAWAYHNLGDTLVKQGGLDEAVVQYHRAIEINPQSACFYLNLGRVMLKKDGFNNASIEYFRQAIQIRPDLLYELNGNYKQLFNSIQTPAYDLCLSENEDIIELTEQPIWVTVTVQPATTYSITGKSSSQQSPTHNQALIQVEFLDKNQKLIPSPYSAIPSSKMVGPYFYIPTSGEHLSEFTTNSFNTSNDTYYLRLGFRTWHNKKPIFLDSSLKLEVDFLVILLETISQRSNEINPLSPKPGTYDNLKNANEAIDLLYQVNHILPNCYGVYDILGDIFLTKGELSKAISAFRQCSMINPNYCFPYDKLRNLYDVKNLGGWAISEELFVYILETLPMGSTILELGSGTGTLELSKYYKMVSIEHNQDWLNKYNSHYIYAPLVDDMWYNPNILKQKLKNIHYDMILIDGPPQHRRKGILSYLDLFNWNVQIIFDDVNRKYDMDVAISLSKHLGKIPTVYKYDKYFAVIKD